MFSVRIVDADFYLTKPVAGLDVLHSEFRQSNVNRVPVVRIFGSTPSGQKTCLHVHQVFPYIFVPYDGTQPSNKYLTQFTTSVDFAVQVALGKASSSTHHVYDASIVRRIPFYGYHEEEKEFIKIQFYNPRIVARVVELLQNGAILNKVFQPFESHIPYILQFLIDFNLYGMNLLHAGKVHFRGWSRPEMKMSKRQPSPSSESSSPFSSNISSLYHVNAASQHWSESTIPSDLRLDSDVAKISRCELEVDVVSTDILNQLEIGISVGSNPGIVAMWEDEKQRRRDHEQSSQITLPLSQDRGDLPVLDAERDFKARIREIISGRNQLVQSQLDKMEKAHLDSLSPEDFHELSQSILLDAKDPETPVILSQDVDENMPVVDETVIEDVLEANQSQSERLSGRLDSELIDILVSLADDPNQPVLQECSPKSITSQPTTAEDRVDESENEDEESLIMSQPVWQDEDLVGDFEERDSNEEVGEFDRELQRIPQLDGIVDDESDMSLSESTCTAEERKEDSCAFGMAESNGGLYIERFSEHIPQLDGCHDDKDENQTRATTSTSRKGALKSKLDKVKFDEDDDDFKTGRRRKAGAVKRKRSRLKPGANLTTRQRKSVVAPLVVSGGKAKARKISSQRRRKSISEATTSKDEQSVKSNKEKYGNKAENTRLDSEILNSEIEDLASCSIQSTSKGRSVTRKGGKKIAGKLPRVSLTAPNTNAELSSGSQTSDFELRLSDNSTDSSDCKNPKKIPKVSVVGENEPNANPFDRVKSENSQKDYEFYNKGKEGSGFEDRGEFQSGFADTLEKRENVKRRTVKSSVNSQSKSEPRERKRTKKAGCLEFTQSPGKAKKGTVVRRDVETLTFRKDSIVSQKRLRSNEPSKEGDLRRRKKKKTGSEDAGKNLRISQEKIVSIKQVQRNPTRGGLLLDARVELERLSIKREKSEENLDLKGCENCDTSDSRVELVHEFDPLNSVPSVADEGSGLSQDALYQMAMVSPKSARSDDESPSFLSSPCFSSSPPFPSSPSLDASILDKISKIVMDISETCDKEDVVCVEDSFFANREGVGGGFDVGDLSELRDRKELDRDDDVNIGASCSSDCLRVREEMEHGGPNVLSHGEISRHEGSNVLSHVEVPGHEGPNVSSRDEISGQEGSNISSHDEMPGQERSIVVSHDDEMPGQERSNVLSHDDDEMPGQEGSIVLSRDDEMPGQERSNVLSHDEMPGQEGSNVLNHDEMPGQERSNVLSNDGMRGQEGSNVLSHDDEMPGHEGSIVLSHGEMPGHEGSIVLSHGEMPGHEGSIVLSHGEMPGQERSNVLSHDEMPGQEGSNVLSHDEMPGQERSIVLSHDEMPGQERSNVLSHDDDEMPGQERSNVLSHDDEMPGQERSNVLSHDEMPGQERSNVLSHDEMPGQERSNVLSHDDEMLGQERSIVSSHDEMPGQERSIVLSRNDEMPGQERSNVLSHDEIPGQERSIVLSHDEMLGQEGSNVLSHDEMPGQERSIVLSHDEMLGQEGSNVLSHDEMPGQERSIVLSHDDEMPGQEGSNVLSHDEIPGQERSIVLSHDGMPGQEGSNVLSHGEMPGQERSIVLSHDDEMPGQERSIVLSHDDEMTGQERSIVLSHDDEMPGQERSIVLSHDDAMPGQERSIVLSHDDEMTGQERSIVLSHDDEMPGQERSIVLSHDDEMPGQERSNVLSHDEMPGQEGSNVLSHDGEMPGQERSIVSSHDDMSGHDGSIVLSPCEMLGREGPNVLSQGEILGSLGQDDNTMNLGDNAQEANQHIKAFSSSQRMAGAFQVWKPTTNPPSPTYVLETTDLYGLPHERHQKAFFSDPKDVPSVSRTVGVRRLHVPSLSVDELSEFDLGSEFLTLRQIRGLMGESLDNSFVRGCLKTLSTEGGNTDNGEYAGSPTEIKLALMGERDTVITPAKLPPSPSAVHEWMKRSTSENVCVTKGSGTLNPNGASVAVGPQTPNTPSVGIAENLEAECETICGDVENSREVHGFQSPQVSGRSGVAREMSQSRNEGGVSQTGSCDVLMGPQHSTPFGGQAKPRTLFQCTPIGAREPCEKAGKPSSQQEVGEPCPRIGALRRNILANPIKETAVQEHRQASFDASCIEGPTPTNSCGFKISQPNIQDAKSLHEVQYLTLLSVELHIRTRKRLKPDPEFDAICAIFYNIEHDTNEGKKNITGVIVANNESTKLNCATDPGASTSTDGVSSRDNVANSDTGVPKEHRTSGSSNFHDSILWKTGFANDFDIITVREECDAIARFIQLVHDWDPDILIGFEVQMLSWGYLLHRATTLGIDLAAQLSRLQDSSGTTRFDAEKNRWGASHTSEITIAGRIVLNVWRLMRHEVTLNIYSFENIAYHVLHERIPLYTFQQLARWWDQKLPHDRWRTAEHYITRCQCNIRILNHSDLINRTSEFARLYGILFYSVISRGSQFRVESMMLRLAKPMNYLAVSPSIQQRARMCAPECIPLVMEPESRFYTDPVVVLDFQSLYPSVIIAYNYCFSTCLGRVSRLDELGTFDFGCTSMNVPPALLEKLENDIHVSANGAAFVKSNVRRGILPRMLEEILNTRVMVKKAMKEYKKEKALGRLLDARQLGLKLIANVTYGYTSANVSGRMPCVEIADAIVRKARETLERAIHLVNTREEWGARVVYGDTDSLFVLLKGATKEEAFKIGKDIVDAVTASNPKPVKLKFEKVYFPCVLQTKKRYVGYMYETLDQKQPDFDAKGIETVRRDTCPAVAKVLEKSLRILFEAKDVGLVKKFVQRQFRKLMEDRVSLQDFIFAKEYRGMRNYKPSACVPALELARRKLSRDRRAEPRVGERVPYVVVYGSPGLPLIQLVRSPEDVLEDPNLRLNAPYYINKQIVPPLNRAFALIGIDVAAWYSELPRYTPKLQVTTAKQKTTISRYFTTLHCPVCEELTHRGLCYGCNRDPQKAVIVLADRIRTWERKYDHLAQICFQCCGTRDAQMFCVSFDCPVLFKVVKSQRKLNYAETLRSVQGKIEVAEI